MPCDTQHCSTLKVAQIQAPQHDMTLSPGVVAAIGRVQLALREALSAQSSLSDIAQGLADRGFLVTLRTGLGVGTDSIDYLSTLRHAFLVCQEGSLGLCIVVDPAFREQFIVAGMPATSSYAGAVSNLPECFVGTIGTVNALICLLTGTLNRDAAANGIELPPWRSKQALLSKWLPRRFADAVFAPPSHVSLHPALRSSVHTLTSSSPNSVNSFPSQQGGQSRCASSKTSDACDSSGALTPLHAEPQTVIRGFSAPSALTSTATRSGSCPSCTTPRSALSTQLAAASEASRSVQLQAQSLWDRCLLLTQTPYLTPQPLQPQPQPTAPSPLHTSQQQRALHQPCRSNTVYEPQQASLGQAGGLLDDKVQSLLVSPAHKRSTGTASLKRGNIGCSLKLSAAALKMLPRIHTVKLAAVAAC